MTNSTIQTHPTRRPDSVTLNESQPHAAFALHTVAPTTTWNSPEAITLIAGDCLLLAGKVWTYSVG